MPGAYLFKGDGRHEFSRLFSVSSLDVVRLRFPSHWGLEVYLLVCVQAVFFSPVFNAPPSRVRWGVTTCPRYA